MVFIKAHEKQFLLAGPLAAVAVAALAVTACGGGAAPGPAQGAAPGQWTTAEVSQFTAAAGAGSSDSQDACAIGYFERDMSFGNAMAVVSVDPASGPSLTAAQVKTALDTKYGTTGGDAADTQFQQTVTDSGNNCTAAAAPSTTPAAAPAAPAPGSDSGPGRDVGVIVHRGLREPGRHRGERMAGAGPGRAPERAAGPQQHLLGRQQ